MDTERSFSRRELAAALGFTALAVGIGALSYRSGQGMAGGAGGADMSAAVTSRVVNGQTLYAGACAGCHGAAAKGGVGPALGASAGWSEAVFAGAVLRGQGSQGRELSAVMPRSEKVGLDGGAPTAEQVSAIHTYVKGLQ